MGVEGQETTAPASDSKRFLERIDVRTDVHETDMRE